MDMNMAQGDAGMPGMEVPQVENKVTIEKMPDGSYQVEMSGHEEMMEDENAEQAQSFRSAQEACQAAISMLDGEGDADAEIMQGYQGPSKRMRKMGVKEVFGE